MKRTGVAVAVAGALGVGGWAEGAEKMVPMTKAIDCAFLGITAAKMLSIVNRFQTLEAFLDGVTPIFDTAKELEVAVLVWKNRPSEGRVEVVQSCLEGRKLRSVL